jgi:hypothetical protein
VLATSRIQLPRIFFGPGLGSAQLVRVGDPIGRWLELAGVFTIPGLGDLELVGDLDCEPGAGLVYLRRLYDSQVWRRHHGGPPPGRARRGGRGAGELARCPSAIRRPMPGTTAGG